MVFIAFILFIALVIFLGLLLIVSYAISSERDFERRKETKHNQRGSSRRL